MKAYNVVNVIRILNSSYDFYVHATNKVDNSGLAMVFNSMADAKKIALKKLQPFAKISEGAPEAGDDWVVKARELYTTIVATLGKSLDHTYIAQLVEVEDKTMAELRSALAETSEPIYAAALRDVYAEMELCHDRMLNLQTITL